MTEAVLSRQRDLGIEPRSQFRAAMNPCRAATFERSHYTALFFAIWLEVMAPAPRPTPLPCARFRYGGQSGFAEAGFARDDQLVRPVSIG